MKAFGIFLLVFSFYQSYSQEASLVYVNDESVSSDEFLYTFTKNQKDSASKEEVDSYLQLYINFKLKVQEARKLGLDTLPTYQRELADYIGQLTKPYLTEKEVSELLIQEGYDRMQEEVSVSHLLLLLPDSPTPADTLEVYRRAMEIYLQATKGNFDSLVQAYSEEPGVAKSNGYLGYFTAFQMVYPFETAAFTTDVGSISMPVRTQFGYHLIYVLDRRPTRGKVQISHIMLRLAPQMTQADSLAKEEEIWGIYELAMDNYNWESLVGRYSEDGNTNQKGGLLNPFGVGEMIPELAEAAFSLDSIGQISDPLKSPFGWHIIRLENLIPLADYSTLRKDIERKISRDTRANKSTEALINRLKIENGYQENAETCSIIRSLNQKMDHLPDTIRNEWEIAAIEDHQLTVADFNKFLQKESSKGVNVLFELFLDEEVIEYERTLLPEKYDEFKYLSKEYAEGILLFDIMTDKIWNPAAMDTIALRAYYQNNLDDYNEEERITVSFFEGSEQNTSTIESFLVENLLDTVTLQSKKEKIILESFTDLRLGLSGTYTRGECSDDFFKTKGVYSTSETNWLVVWNHTSNRVLPFEQIKGRLVADYQLQLESEWISQLRSIADIKINKKELKRVYKTIEN